MKRELLKNNNGFTLVELMITVFLTAIAVVAIYRGYTSFSKAADAQQQMIELQQNLRIGMHTLTKDIIRAGMKEEDTPLVAFALAGTSEVEFGMDLTGAEHDGEDDDGDGAIDEPGEGDEEDNDNDGDKDEEDEARIGDGDFNDDGERVHYFLLEDEDTNNNGVLDAGEDDNGNGVLDTGRLRREVWDRASASYDPPQTIITNVSALNFFYIKEDGSPVTLLPENDSGILDKIETVEITMVVRATNEDYRITNSETYENLQGTPIYTAPGDNLRRRAMSMRVKIRNAQLQN